MKKILGLLIFIFVLGSCKTEKQAEPKEEVVVVNKSELSIRKEHQGYSELTEVPLEETKKWKEYNDVTSFLARFKNASANQILTNAVELKKLANLMRDSIRVEMLKIQSFKARLNVFENEALRLADMTEIPAITPEEVHNQTNKLLYVYSSINDKINTIYQQKRLEDEIDVKDVFIGLDSTKIDSTSKKTIEEELKLLEEENRPTNLEIEQP